MPIESTKKATVSESGLEVEVYKNPESGLWVDMRDTHITYTTEQLTFHS